MSGTKRAAYDQEHAHKAAKRMYDPAFAFTSYRRTLDPMLNLPARRRHALAVEAAG